MVDYSQIILDYLFICYIFIFKINYDFSKFLLKKIFMYCRYLFMNVMREHPLIKYLFLARKKVC